MAVYDSYGKILRKKNGAKNEKLYLEVDLLDWVDAM